MNGNPLTGRHAVVLTSVTKTYGAGSRTVTALDGVTLAFRRAALTAVMGPPGAGKSTLLRCAAGLEHPDSGSIRHGTTELAHLAPRPLSALSRARIGFVFQRDNLVPVLTAGQNVAVRLLLARRSPLDGEVSRALAQVGLVDRARHRPAELSSAQRRRVALACALVTRPDVLFCDEPTGSLDSAAERGVLALLRSLVDHCGQTVVMSTGDPVVASHADRVVFLDDGRFTGQLGGRPTARHIDRETDRQRSAMKRATPGTPCSSSRNSM
ncbi:ABC transporter ATP-binding protein [Streptomyces sp. NPDC057011]|uniref:ABC transporter ATP-binding protein n=1 Tax=unclassified Streptomyces TaxID=2593676 RepID=UPI0036333C13